MKKIFLLIVVMFFGTSILLKAQVNDHSESYIELSLITEQNPKTYSIRETPDFVFNGNGRKNHLSALTIEQEEYLLQAYKYPLYVSYGYKFLERDIYLYQKSLKAWNEGNEYRFEEIQETIGFNK